MQSHDNKHNYNVYGQALYHAWTAQTLALPRVLVVLKPALAGWSSCWMVFLLDGPLIGVGMMKLLMSKITKQQSEAVRFIAT